MPKLIFVPACRNRGHLAVITLAAQPAEKSAFEQLGVEPVGLGAPVFARYGYARCVDNVRSRSNRPPRSLSARRLASVIDGLLARCERRRGSV